LFAFFSYSGEGFFILYKESKENKEIHNARLVGNIDDSSILLSVEYKHLLFYQNLN